MLPNAPHKCSWCAVSSSIWQRVDLGAAYPFMPGPVCRQRLAQLLSPKEMGAIFATPDATIVNLKLRETIGPKLASKDRKLASDLAVWIVREWGGIRAGKPEAIRQWSDALGDYDAARVSAFVGKMGSIRVSSWSKLLAFADHVHHAVYDARTAVALNCALASINDRRRFFMPLSRNTDVAAAQRALEDPKTPMLCYSDYLGLLECVAASVGMESLLKAEMLLFANAPKIAGRFVSGIPEKGKR